MKERSLSLSRSHLGTSFDASLLLGREGEFGASFFLVSASKLAVKHPLFFDFLQVFDAAFRRYYRA